MNILRIEVAGYTVTGQSIRKTFYVRDAAEFGERVLAWEQEYSVWEWSKCQR